MEMAFLQARSTYSDSLIQEECKKVLNKLIGNLGSQKN